MLDGCFRSFASSQIIEDQPLQYVGRNGEPLACRVRLFRIAGDYILVATDLGAAVTETIDRIATIMVRRWEIAPERLRVVEHHDYTRAARAPSEPRETFAFVGFDWFKGVASNPTWRATTRADVQAMLGNQTLW